VRRTRRLEQAFWTAHSRTWDDALADDDLARHVDHLAAWLAAAIRPAGVVVDLGCGTGNHATALARRGLSVIGVDLSPGMLGRARGKAPHIALVRADLAAALPLAPASVDGVLSVYAAQFLDLGPFFGSVRTVLRPGGSLLVEVPRPDTQTKARAHLPARHRAFQRVKQVAQVVGTRAGVVRRHTPEQIRTALAGAGFTLDRDELAERSYALSATAA
jgi:SAM-dependent methyltransferase